MDSNLKTIRRIFLWQLFKCKMTGKHGKLILMRKIGKINYPRISSFTKLIDFLEKKTIKL